MQNCKEMALTMFHFSTKAEQIETQYGGEVWQGSERRRDRQTGAYFLTSAALASGEIEISRLITPKHRFPIFPAYYRCLTSRAKLVTHLIPRALKVMKLKGYTTDRTGCPRGR